MLKKTFFTIIILAVLGGFYWQNAQIRELADQVGRLTALGANQAISALTALTSPDDADTLAIVDNGVSPATTKKITWANATSSLQTWYDGRYSLIAGSASIVTVGALTSGSLGAGFTAVPVSLGGTGTTSPAQYRVLFGNAGSGITMATSTGTSGMFLTSCGANCFPQWTTSAIDQAANYTWTGSHTFPATVANPLTLNGLAYNFFGSRAASSTVLTEDGSGNLRFLPVQSQVLYASNVKVSTTDNSATTTFTTVVIPANTLTTSNMLRITANITSESVSSENDVDYQFGNGVSTSTIFSTEGGSTMRNQSIATIVATSTTGQHTHQTHGTNSNGASVDATLTMKGSYVTTYYSTAAPLYIAFRGRPIDSGNLAGYESILVELLGR